MGNKQAVHEAVNSDIERCCKPKITHRDINNLIKELKPFKKVQKNGDILLLEYCHTVIRDYQQEDWSDAKITITCPKSHREIVFFSGNQQNEFEVFLGSWNTPKCEKLQGAKATEGTFTPPSPPPPPTSSSSSSSSLKEEEEEEIITPCDYHKWFSPPIKQSSIQVVIKELQTNLNEDEKRLLQHCQSMIEQEKQRTGQRQWNDVTITILCDRGWKIVISTNRNYKTTNEYEVWMDCGRATHSMTNQGWSEYVWSGYSYLPSMDTFSSAVRAITWW